MDEKTKDKIMSRMALNTAFVWWFAFVTGFLFVYSQDNLYMMLVIGGMIIFQILLYKKEIKPHISKLLEKS